MAKRRTPPLFEVLSSPGRTARGGVGVVGGPPRAVEVRLPSPNGTPNGAHKPAATPAHDPGARRAFWTVVAICGGALILILAILYSIAYSKGNNDGQREIVNKLLPSATPPGAVIHDPQVTGPSTVLPSGTEQSSGITPATTQKNPPLDSAQADTPPSGDPRKPGFNYLNVVVLNWKDAEKAAQYLTKNGVPAAAVAHKGIDPAAARAKNLPLLVVVLDGVPSDQFSATKQRRADLIEKVRRLGKKWQSDERGPSDFGEPFWAAFKEPGSAKP